MTSIFLTHFRFRTVAEHFARKPWLLYFICVMVLFFGLALSSLGMSTAFARSGSVLVSISLCFVYINHYMSKEIELKEKIIEKNPHLDSYSKAKRNLGQMGADISDEQLHENALNVSRVIETSKKNLPELKTASSKITAAEFIAGIVGTLVWGFGDIPFNAVCA